MKIDIKQIENMSELAALELNGEKKKLYKNQLESIFGWINQLNEINTEKIKTAHNMSFSKKNIRKDKAEKFPNTEKILSNAPLREFDFVKVKKVLENE